MTAFSEWQNFYVIVGSSAGALIGLQFVVLALISDMPDIRRGREVGVIFATPTTVYFGAALFLAAAMSIPWHSAIAAAATLAAGGLAGLFYAAHITQLLRGQTAYRPEAEDWWFHSILPLLAFAGLTAASACLRVEEQSALIGVAVSALLLLFVGIHNAWDTVTYHVFVHRKKHDAQSEITKD